MAARATAERSVKAEEDCCCLATAAALTVTCCLLCCWTEEGGEQGREARVGGGAALVKQKSVVRKADPAPGQQPPQPPPPAPPQGAYLAGPDCVAGHGDALCSMSVTRASHVTMVVVVLQARAKPCPTARSTPRLWARHQLTRPHGPATSTTCSSWRDSSMPWVRRQAGRQAGVW